jgi:hypothetical protein
MDLPPAMLAAMKFPPADRVDMYEQLAAEFLTEQGEAVYRDNCDQLDRFSDAALADQLVTREGRMGQIDFEQVVEAFGRLRSEDGVTVSEIPGS